jgi:hypothetical protein
MECFLQGIENNITDVPHVTLNSDASTQDVSTITYAVQVATKIAVIENNNNNSNNNHINTGGHPKGSTCAAKEQYTLTIKQAMTDAAQLYLKAKEEAEQKGKYVS